MSDEPSARFKPMEKRCIWPIRRHRWSHWWVTPNMQAQYRKCLRCGQVYGRST